MPTLLDSSKKGVTGRTWGGWELLGAVPVRPGTGQPWRPLAQSHQTLSVSSPKTQSGSLAILQEAVTSRIIKAWSDQAWLCRVILPSSLTPSSTHPSTHTSTHTPIHHLSTHLPIHLSINSVMCICQNVLKSIPFVGC